MSLLDDVIVAIEGVKERVSEASTAASGVLQQTEQALATAEALGANAAVQGLTMVRQQVEELVNEITGLVASTEAVQDTAKSVADST